MPSAASDAFLSSLPQHCAPTSLYLERLSSAFHVCVPTSLALLSSALGIFSIIAWLFAQVPQIYKNWKLQSASGLSIYFLLEWLAGDVTNLAGAILTGQASWQVGVAIYYVFVDVCLSGQYFWYTHAKPGGQSGLDAYKPSGEDDENEPAYDETLVGTPSEGTKAEDGPRKQAHPEHKPEESQPVNTNSTGRGGDDSFPRLSEKISGEHTRPLFNLSRRSIITPQLSRGAITTSLLGLAAAMALPNEVTKSSTPDDTAHASVSAGQIISWISTLCYIGSRLPQIYKNSVRRSTAGLSPYMFLAAFCGNFFYSAAIITNPLAWSSYPPYGGYGWAGPEGSDRVTWVALAAPFWLGAAGVLALDATVGIQFLVYGDGQEVDVLVEDGKGRSRWKKVSGWMRGWVPSPSPRMQATEVEGERSRLVAARQRSRSTGYGGT